MDESILYNQKCKSSKELFKIKRNVGTIFDGVERCKETIAKRTYFGHIDPFIQNIIEANFCPEIQRISADLEKFHLYLKEEMVAGLRYFNSLELEVDSLKSQLETQKTQFLNEIDRLSKEYYYADHMNAILGVYTELDEVTNLQCDYLETLDKCECLENKLSKSKMMSKSFEALRKHAINLEIDLQQYADLSETPVDQMKYHSMVGALMYLTASRPDIMHATCYCARYQAKPTEKHLTAVKRIFRYLKDTIHMGLWYLKDIGFKLTGFSDSNHAGCLDLRKSTSGGIQFLGGDNLVSWSSKKQDCTSMSSAKAETEYQLADLFTKALPERKV
nr:uncharacterized mitochondrial protein AtMg00810-like [Tanacetum cinerariifolium]